MQKATSDLQQVQLYYEQGRWEEAISACERVIADCRYQLQKQNYEPITSQPNISELYSAEFQVNLGSLYAEQQNWTKAIAYYQKAISLDPTLATAYRNLARVFIKTNQTEAATEAWYQALKLEPTWAKADEHYNLGNSLVKQGKIEQAEVCYRQAIKLQPNFAAAYRSLAGLLGQQQKKQEAIKIYDDLASILVNQEKYDLAIECYRWILTLTKELKYLNPKLIAEYKKTIEFCSESTALDYYQLAGLFRSEGQFNEAIEYYQKAIEIRHDFEPAYIALQYTKTNPEYLEQRISFYRKILDENSKNYLAWGNLGDALTEQVSLDEAISCYQNSCYQKTLADYPNLAEIEWKQKKELSPDFIIIGALKGGTTSLYKYLGCHPQVLLPHKKEIGFFSQNFKCGVDWYLSHFPSITDSPEFITGESTPIYLNCSASVERVFQLFPKVKLIVLLRNPVDQVISWHYHKVNTGLYKKTLEEAIQTQLKPIDNCSESEIMQILDRQKGNLMGCLYVYQLKRWMKLFPREQFLILRSEDFYAKPANTIKHVFDFLGIDDYELKDFPCVNVGRYGKVSDKLKDKIAAYFRPHNQKLEEFLEMKFNWH